MTYTYDSAGNRTSLTRTNAAASLLPAAVASASYDAANEQTAFAGATLTYDANGNLTNDGVNSYHWDARNRLIAISGGATANFSYDALGRRTSKVIGSTASQFLYDGNDVAAEIGGGAVGVSYLRGLNIDEPFVRQMASGNEFYHTDALGSSLALSHAQGASGTTYTYEPFGKTTVMGTSSNAFQFTGRENDGTGVYFYRFRVYAPTLARFLSEDPIGMLSGDTNFYPYVAQDPVSFRDPFGLLGYGGAAVLGCGTGAGFGLGGRKPIQGAVVGGFIGCSYSPLLVGLQLLPTYRALSIALGAYVGAVSAAAGAAAQGGDLTDIGIGFVSGGIAGGIGGAIPGPFASTFAAQGAQFVISNGLERLK
jgi:RHS repeat-associated protein